MRATRRLRVYRAMRKSLKKDFRRMGDWEYTGFCSFLTVWSFPFRTPSITELTELYDMRPPSKSAKHWWYQYGEVRPRLELVERAVEEVKGKIWYYRAWNKIKY